MGAPVNNLHPSQKILAFIATMEACVLVAYPDGKDRKTGRQRYAKGFGHNDGTVRRSEKITLEESFALLKADVMKWAPFVNKRIEPQLTQQQFDAILSISYNRGFAGLTPIADHLNEGGLLAAEAAILSDPVTARAGRRHRELAIFEHGDYGVLSYFSVFDGLPSKTKARAVAIGTIIPGL